MSSTDSSKNRTGSADTLALAAGRGDVRRLETAGPKKKPKKQVQPKTQKATPSSTDGPSPFKVVSERNPLTDLSGLLQITPEPIPKTPQASQLQVSTILDQVKRMRKDVAKLHEVALKYKCLEKYEEDVDYLVTNVENALKEGKSKKEEK